MNSMTGWGFSEAVLDGVQLSVEMKSVNSRFLDIQVNLPDPLSRMETTLRKEVAARVARGKVDVTVRVHEGAASKLIVDKEAAARYYTAFREVAHELGMAEGSVPLALVVAQEGVLVQRASMDCDRLWRHLRPVFEEAMAAFLADREREGESLRCDLAARLEELTECTAFFAAWLPRMEARYRELVECHFRKIIADTPLDDSKVLAETAALVVRYTINEEVVRLQSHLAALKNEIDGGVTPGKRLDFICQEANREINTIGSKSQFTEVSQMVIRAKDALENIREQSRNVE